MSGREAQDAEKSDLSLSFGMSDRWEAAVKQETHKGGGRGTLQTGLDLGRAAEGR